MHGFNLNYGNEVLLSLFYFVPLLVICLLNDSVITVLVLISFICFVYTYFLTCRAINPTF